MYKTYDDISSLLAKKSWQRSWHNFPDAHTHTHTLRRVSMELQPSRLIKLKGNPVDSIFRGLA